MLFFSNNKRVNKNHAGKIYVRLRAIFSLAESTGLRSFYLRVRSLIRDLQIIFSETEEEERGLTSVCLLKSPVRRRSCDFAKKREREKGGEEIIVLPGIGCVTRSASITADYRTRAPAFIADVD